MQNLDARIRDLESLVSAQEERSKNALAQRDALLESINALRIDFVKIASDSNRKLAVQEARITELVGMHKRMTWQERGMIGLGGSGVGAVILRIIETL